MQNSYQVWYVLAFIFALFCLAVFTYVRRQLAIERAEFVRLAELNQATLAQLVSDVDDACARLGRAPIDQTELEMQFDEPLPKINAHGALMPIRYVRKSEYDYYLSYFSMAGHMRYDSDQREFGWTKFD